MKPRLLLVAAVGAVVGTLAELVHLRAGVWIPACPAALPWWITAVYFGGFAGLGVLLDRYERVPGRGVGVSRRALALECVAFLALLFAPAALWSHERVLLGLCTGWLAVRLLVLRARGDLGVAACAALANLAIELPLVLRGLYRYPGAEVLPLPLWLAPFWAGLALSLRRFFAFAR